MYSFLLSSHSLIRWIVLATVLITLFRSYYGWLSNKSFTKSDNTLRLITLSAVHIQAMLGIVLYCISPIIRYFFNNFKEAVHEKEFRFFGMEHSLMMLTAVVFITIASITSKKKDRDQQKFKTLAVWFSIAVLIILFSIPWNFGEITANRPWIRNF
ncbi:hypothetical protein [Cytophaga aurantiaca]|uniref:hypothetical protein n=1 Tax=Cytophaga aurantiaca TaxID=29530 RepID=UPI00037F2F02|nr:hypothetical protein [Cytophaga aurantiaca]